MSGDQIRVADLTLDEALAICESLRHAAPGRLTASQSQALQRARRLVVEQGSIAVERLTRAALAKAEGADT